MRLPAQDLGLAAREDPVFLFPSASLKPGQRDPTTYIRPRRRSAIRAGCDTVWDQSCFSEMTLIVRSGLCSASCTCMDHSVPASNDPSRSLTISPAALV